jgi:hypothetical protein
MYHARTVARIGAHGRPAAPSSKIRLDGDDPSRRETPMPPLRTNPQRLSPARQDAMPTRPLRLLH